MGASCRVFDASLSYMEISHKLGMQIKNTLVDQKIPEAMRDVMARMMGAKCVDLDVSQYCDFLTIIELNE